MTNVQIIPFDEKQHKTHLIQLFQEYRAWAKEALLKYDIKQENLSNLTSEEFTEKVINIMSMKPPDGLILILDVDGVAKGMGRLSKLDDKIAEINNMFINSEYRGKGYGKQIFKELEKKAREYGYTTLRLDTGPHNEAAQHVYRKMGFKERDYYGSSEYGRFAQDTTEDGRRYYEMKIYMEKKLV
jgi:ribosomal protein S18 acetylase RimI-like enzyme